MKSFSTTAVVTTAAITVFAAATVNGFGVDVVPGVVVPAAVRRPSSSSSFPSYRRVAAFTFLPAAGRDDYEPLAGETKINLKVDLDVPKVATMDEIEKGKKVYCRCWLSGTFPLCDGTHQKHNEATGDNVGPLIVSVKKE